MTSAQARREAISRSIAALSCMRRSGESYTALAKRDAEIARLEAELRSLKDQS